MVLFALPWGAPVAVVGPDEDGALLDANERRVLYVSERELPADQRSDLAKVVEPLRLDGFQFILLPAAASGSSTQSTVLEDYLQRTCRLVVREPDACTIYAIADEPEAARLYRPPDHIPIPPPELVQIVASVYRPHKFFETGALSADCMRTALRRQGRDMNDFKAVLEVGCGCGRIMRHWKWLSGPALHGTDYNPYMIQWCSEHLTFAEFRVNGLSPPLEYESDSFDFVYACSVLTHLDEPLQHPWIRELTRILEPGGYLYLTLCGMPQIGNLDPQQRDRFLAGELVVRGPDGSGTNECTAYHPESYVRDSLGRDLELKDFVKGGAEDSWQDLYLFRKP